MEDGRIQGRDRGKEGRNGGRRGEEERRRERLQMSYCHPKIDTLGILIFYSL